jgi:hypothetical protein
MILFLQWEMVWGSESCYFFNGKWCGAPNRAIFSMGNGVGLRIVLFLQWEMVWGSELCYFFNGKWCGAPNRAVQFSQW